MEIISKLRARQSIIAKYAQMTNSNDRAKKIEELEERKNIVEKYLKITDKKEKEDIINDLKERQAIIKQYEHKTPEEKQTRISNAGIEINSAEKYLKECEDLENTNVKSLINGMNKQEANDKINSIINKTSEKKNKIESIKKNKRLIEVLSLKEPMKEYDYMDKCIDVLGIDDLDMEKKRIEEEIGILSLENNMKEYQNIDNMINRLKVTTLENIQNWDLAEFAIDKELDDEEIDNEEIDDEEVNDEKIDDEEISAEQTIFDDEKKNRYWELLQKDEQGKLSDEEKQEFDKLDYKLFNEVDYEEFDNIMEFLKQKRNEKKATFTQEQMEELWKLQQNIHNLSNEDKQKYENLCEQVKKLDREKRKEVFNFIQQEKDKLDREKYERNKKTVNSNNFNMTVGSHKTIIKHRDEEGNTRTIKINTNGIKSMLNDKELISKIKDEAYTLMGDSVSERIFEDNDIIFLWGVLKAHNHEIVEFNGEVIKGLDTDIAKNIISNYIHAKYSKDPYSHDLIKNIVSFDLSKIKDDKEENMKLRNIALEYSENNMANVIESRPSKLKNLFDKVGALFMSGLRNRKNVPAIEDKQQSGKKHKKIFVQQVDTPLPNNEITPEEEANMIKIQHEGQNR